MLLLDPTPDNLVKVNRVIYRSRAKSISFMIYAGPEEGLQEINVGSKERPDDKMLIWSEDDIPSYLEFLEKINGGLAFKPDHVHTDYDFEYIKTWRREDLPPFDPPNEPKRTLTKASFHLYRSQINRRYR